MVAAAENYALLAGNEKLCDSHTNNGSAVKAVFKALDPLMRRPTSANCDAGQHFPPPVWYQETEDLVGFDYGTTSYDKWLDLIGPDKLAISSETSSAQSDRGEYGYGSDPEQQYIPAFHVADHGTGCEYFLLLVRPMHKCERSFSSSWTCSN